MLTARRFESSGTAKGFVVRYSLSPAASLCAPTERLNALLPDIFGDYRPLADLVSQMML
jgi:hypothetical protein